MTGSNRGVRRNRVRWLLAGFAGVMAVALWPRRGPERLVEVPDTSISYDVSDGRLFWRTVDRRQNLSTWSMPVTGGKARLEKTEPPVGYPTARMYPQDARQTASIERSIRRVWPLLPKQPRLFRGESGTLSVGPVDATSGDVCILLLEDGAVRPRVVRRYHVEEPDLEEGRGGLRVNIPNVAEVGGWVVFQEEPTEERPDGQPISTRRVIAACKADGSKYRVLRKLEGIGSYVAGLSPHKGSVYVTMQRLATAGGRPAYTTVLKTTGGGSLMQVLDPNPTDNVFFDGPYAYYVAPQKRGSWLESMMGTGGAVSRVLYRVRLAE